MNDSVIIRGWEDYSDVMRACVDHFNKTEKMRREVMVDNVLVNFDVLRRDGELEE